MIAAFGLHRGEPTGVRLLAVFGVLASACSDPYAPEGQFWPTDVGTGGSVSQNTGGSAAGGSPTVSSGGLGLGGTPASTSGGNLGAGGATSQTLGGSSQDTGGSAASGSSAISSGGLGPGGTSGGSFGFSGATNQTTAGASSGGTNANGGANGRGGSASSGGSVTSSGGSGMGGSPGAGGGTSSANCSLSVKVTTAPAGGRYAPKNIGAIWVADQSGNFIRSLEVWAQQRVNHLTQWNSVTSRAGAAGSRVDIISQATLPSHKAHTATWNCQDFKRLPVPDGTYRVYFEMTDNSGSGPNRFKTFTKGPTAVTLNPADNTNFKAMELSFKP